MTLVLDVVKSERLIKKNGEHALFYYFIITPHTAHRTPSVSPPLFGVSNACSVRYDEKGKEILSCTHTGNPPPPK